LRRRRAPARLCATQINQNLPGRIAGLTGLELGRVLFAHWICDRHPLANWAGASWVQSLHKFGAANFKKAWRTDEASTLASRDITPVEHDDDSEHRSDIDDLRYVIQNNGEALSAGVPKFLMSVARQYRHQA